MRSNVAELSTNNNKRSQRHRFLVADLRANFAFCRAIPALLATTILMGAFPTPKASLFVPPHLVPAASTEKNEHFFRVIVRPPPPPSPPSPTIQPPANSRPIPALCSFQLHHQETWRVVLGELCQLPNLRRPTENSSYFAECEQLDWGIAEVLNRTDLGVWRLRSCDGDTVFVPSAQRCLTRRSVLLQNKICSKNSVEVDAEVNKGRANDYSFCPPGVGIDAWMTVRRRMLTGRCLEEEETPEGKTERKKEPDGNCDEVDGPEVVEPCRIQQVGDDKPQQLPTCPCNSNNCVCLESRHARMFPACCCPLKQTLPCQCPPIPPHYVAVGSRLLPADRTAPPQPNQEIANKVSLEGPEVPLPSVMEQPRPCPLIDRTKPQSVQYQELCSWMLDPLVPDSESHGHFLQCQPAPFSLYCGRWQRMPCAPKTVFDVREQMCVWDQGQQKAILSARDSSFDDNGEQPCACRSDLGCLSPGGDESLP
uniref:Chitin-binding type-2 domain-containing protein n=1 Tax=Globodera pallida TaxID=36090 RepID=A0A183CMC3_GLOPA